MSATAAKPPEIRIDRLALDLPGLDEAAAGRLAELVASHLARAELPPGRVTIPRLALTLDAPETDLNRLAQRIAGAVLGAR